MQSLRRDRWREAGAGQGQPPAPDVAPMGRWRMPAPTRAFDASLKQYSVDGDIWIGAGDRSCRSGRSDPAEAFHPHGTGNGCHGSETGSKDASALAAPSFEPARRSPWTCAAPRPAAGEGQSDRPRDAGCGKWRRSRAGASETGMLLRSAPDAFETSHEPLHGGRAAGGSWASVRCGSRRQEPIGIRSAGLTSGHRRAEGPGIWLTKG